MLSLTVALTFGFGADLLAGTIWTLPPLAVAVKAPFAAVVKDVAKVVAIVDAVLPFAHLADPVTPLTVALMEPASYSVIFVAAAPPVSDPVAGEPVKSVVLTILKARLPALPVTLLVRLT